MNFECHFLSGILVWILVITVEYTNVDENDWGFGSAWIMKQLFDAQSFVLDVTISDSGCNFFRSALSVNRIPSSKILKIIKACRSYRYTIVLVRAHLTFKKGNASAARPPECFTSMMMSKKK